LFVGSSNFPSDFHHKGGKEVIKAFQQIARQRDDAAFTIRCRVPSNLIGACNEIPNLTLMQDTVTQSEMNRVFADADLFVFPSHYTPGMVFLDAMSFGLPVITTDVWANKEIVIDGKNGTLLRPAESLVYEDEYRNPQWSSKNFVRKISRTTYDDVVAQLISSIHYLLDNDGLRMKMGEEAYQMTQDGPLSLRRRNVALEGFLSRACEDQTATSSLER
jgi:glycosyltransferase involved in cell wall biosynthesis